VRVEAAIPPGATHAPSGQGEGAQRVPGGVPTSRSRTTGLGPVELRRTRRHFVLFAGDDAVRFDQGGRLLRSLLDEPEVLPEGSIGSEGEPLATLDLSSDDARWRTTAS
jgi:hypothetical protein